MVRRWRVSGKSSGCFFFVFVFCFVCVFVFLCRPPMRSCGACARAIARGWASPGAPIFHPCAPHRSPLLFGHSTRHYGINMGLLLPAFSSFSLLTESRSTARFARFWLHPRTRTNPKDIIMYKYLLRAIGVFQKKKCTKFRYDKTRQSQFISWEPPLHQFMAL